MAKEKSFVRRIKEPGIHTSNIGEGSDLTVIRIENRAIYTTDDADIIAALEKCPEVEAYKGLEGDTDYSKMKMKELKKLIKKRGIDVPTDQGEIGEEELAKLLKQDDDDADKPPIED